MYKISKNIIGNAEHMNVGRIDIMQWTDKQDFVDDVVASDVNTLAAGIIANENAIVALSATIGTINDTLDTIRTEGI